MNKIVAKSDLVKLQMTALHSSQPPLDQQGFTKLDDFQIEVINNINNRVSTIVSAPLLQVNRLFQDILLLKVKLW